jgi:molybdopterin converting factor small subunit
MPSRRVTVTLHARAGELAGAREAAVEVTEAASCAEVKRALALRHPTLAHLLSACALATDEEFLGDAAPVGDAASLHLIPPVSGG